MTLKDYLLKSCASRSVPGIIKTLENYIQDMNGKAETASYKDILQYIGSLRKRQLNPKTITTRLNLIKQYYRYLVEIGVRKDHPCQKLKLKDQIDPSIKVETLYTNEQLETYFENHKSRNPFFETRDKVMISLLIYQALSTAELTELTISDIDLEKAEINIKESRSKKGRKLPLKPKQIMLFHNYLHESRPKIALKNPQKCDYFILSSYGKQFNRIIVNEILNDHKPKKERLQAQKMRQSVIANYLKEKKDIRLVQVFAGHRRAGSTEEYKQSGLEELKANINKLHPLQ